jgi:hypothetical protein
VSASLPENLNVEPFPPLRWSDCCWQGTIVLGSWAGFTHEAWTCAAGEYDGTARVIISIPGQARRLPPSPEQAAAYRYLVDQEKGVHNSVLQAIFNAYPTLTADLGLDEEDSEEAEALASDIDRPDRLRELIGLCIVHLLPISREGLAYTGFEFGCTWEEEHGLGVLLHRDRVVRIGQASTAFAETIARTDVDEYKG